MDEMVLDASLLYSICRERAPEMLSFVVLSDGPCMSKSFRPNEDQTQWWARRDALVRIVAASCYLGSHEPNPATKDLTLFFHNGQESQVSDKDNLITAVAIFDPMSLSQEIAIPTESNVLRLLRVAFSKAERTPAILLHQQEVNSNGKISSIISSTTLWREKVSSSDNQAALAEAGKSLKHLNVASMDKKELLAHLQASCPLDFLRQHRLNGHEKLILKKVNKAQLESVWSTWNQSHDQQASADLSSSAQTSDFQYLLNSFLVLLSRKQGQQVQVGSKRKHDDVSTQLTILLLHEDYPHELPVYGNDHSGASMSNSDNSYKSEDNQEVICVMGGVRDATDAEITALMTAAEQLNIPVVGANLGRTAEFTSKIISTLCGHAISKRVVQAVNKLPRISLRAGVVLQKLPSLRSTTWDGYHTVSRPTTQLVEGTRNTPISAAFKQEMIVIAKVPFRKDELTTDVSSREKLFPLIQLFISVMWKSRMASEDAAGEVQGIGVDSTLIIVFQDQIAVKFERKEVAEKIAESHMAAPSEFQVLSMIMELTAQDSSHLPAKKLEKYRSDDIIEQVLFYMLPSKLEKDERKSYLKHARFFRPSNIRPMNYATIQNMSTSFVQPLASSIYSEHCGCSSQHGGVPLDGSFKYFVVLDLVGPRNDSNISNVLYNWRYKSNDIDGDKLKKLQSLVSNAPLLDLLRCPGSLAIVLLQQWAYHLRLHALH